MSLDARLDGFISRLETPTRFDVEFFRATTQSSNLPQIRDNAIQATLLVSSALRSLGIPYYPIEHKISNTRKQYYIEPQPGWLDEQGRYIGLSLLDFSARIKAEAAVLAEKLVERVRDLECFYQLECPEGVEIALFHSPVRLVMAYDINYDSYRARFDISGDSKSPLELSQFVRIPNGYPSNEE